MVRARTLACSGMQFGFAEFPTLTSIRKAAGHHRIHDRWDDVRRGQNNCFVESRLRCYGNAVITGWHIRPQLVKVFYADTCFYYDWVLTSISYLEMIRAAAEGFPNSVYDPPPESSSNAPSLNLNLGGVNVSLGGPGGSGVYRTSSDNVGVQAEGIRDGVRSLFGKVKQGVDKIVL